jgi:hypothetical protein
MAPADPLGQLAAGPIFVIGHMRSGTTWVYETLTAHPAVAGAFETWLFTNRAGLAGLFHAVHWDRAEIARGERFTGHPVGLSQLVGREEILREVRELTGGWLAARLEPHHRFLVEKTPRHLIAMPLIAEVFPGARFVHVLRDGRDVIVSKRAVAPGWARPGRPSRRSTYREARSWRSDLERVRADSREVADRLTEVRFESLTADPRGAARRLFEFCRIPCDEATLDEVVRATQLDRSSADEGGFRRAGRVGDWAGRFSLLDALLFELAAGGALVSSGYESRRLVWALRGRNRPV